MNPLKAKTELILMTQCPTVAMGNTALQMNKGKKRFSFLMCESLITSIKMKTKTPTKTTDLSSKIISVCFWSFLCIQVEPACLSLIQFTFSSLLFIFIYFIKSSVPIARQHSYRSPNFYLCKVMCIMMNDRYF